jgi:hypothetical protein
LRTFAYVGGAAPASPRRTAPKPRQETGTERNVRNTAKKWIVETDWLAEHLDAPDLIVFDGSWHLPTAKRDPKAEYLAEHIPGALFFDIDDLSDEKSTLPHMLPSTVKFASRMKKMGVGDCSRPRACGGPSAPWGMRTSPCSMAALKNGRPKGVRSRTASRRGAPSATSRR